MDLDIIFDNMPPVVYSIFPALGALTLIIYIRKLKAKFKRCVSAGNRGTGGMIIAKCSKIKKKMYRKYSDKSRFGQYYTCDYTFSYKDREYILEEAVNIFPTLRWGRYSIEKPVLGQERSFAVNILEDGTVEYWDFEEKPSSDDKLLILCKLGAGLFILCTVLCLIFL